MTRMLLSLLLFAIAVAADAADLAPVLVYPCSRVQTAPRMDGTLNDPAWDAAPWVSGFVQYDKPAPAAVPTSFRALFDEKALYLGIRCAEPLWQRVIVGTPALRDEHAEVFRAEGVEVFVDPGHDHGEYFQIAANVSGSIFDGRGTDSSWSGKATARGAVTEGQWTMTVTLPWADFGLKPRPGLVVGFNVCRGRNLGDREWTTWAHTAANFHDPVHFGHLVLDATPEMIGKLSAELRKGGMEGPLRLYAPDGVSGTTYLALAAEAIKTLETTLGELEAVGRQENAAVAGVIGKRVAEARAAIAPVSAKVKTGQAFDADEWTRADATIQRLRVGMEKALWDARLQALLSGI